MTTNGRDLLDQVSARPDDDQPRLAYADHVEPYEPDYAEFVRLQVARANVEKQTKALRSQWGAREHELYSKHELEWARYIQKYVRESQTDHGWGFERGFIGFVRMEPENFVALGDRLFIMAPVQHADLYGGREPVRPLFSSPSLARLDSLSLAGAGLDDDDAEALAACDYLQRCTWLDLSRNKISLRGVKALARSPMMRNKVVVNLRHNPVDPIERPDLDYDGTILNITQSNLAKDIEAEVGPVPWFTYPWDSPGPPDRFHARWVGRP